MSHRLTSDDWPSTAFAILSPACAAIVASSGHTLALAVLFWALGAACPVAWLVGELRRRAVVVAVTRKSVEEEKEEDDHGRA